MPDRGACRPPPQPAAPPEILLALRSPLYLQWKYVEIAGIQNYLFCRQ